MIFGKHFAPLVVVAAFAGCGRTAVPPGSSAGTDEIEKPIVWKRLENGEPDIDEVYTHCCKIIRDSLKNPETAEISEQGSVKRADTEEASWWVKGRVVAENALGNRLNQEWEINLLWNRPTDHFAPEIITLGDKTVYLSPKFRQIMAEIARAMGNEMSGLPEDVAKEIRNVQAAVEDAIRLKTREVFSLQWPDDPARHELKVQLNADGLWEATGKQVRFDGSPRRDVSALVTRGDFVVVDLHVGNHWLIGKPPREKPEPESDTKPRERLKPVTTPDDPPKAVPRSASKKPAKPTDEEEEEAKKLLEKAGRFFRTERWSSSRSLLEQIVEDHPQTKAGKEAKKLLEKFPKKK
jgi:hypothetical protein